MTSRPTMRILIADDNAGDSASSGREELRMARELIPDLIIQVQSPGG